MSRTIYGETIYVILKITQATIPVAWRMTEEDANKVRDQLTAMHAAEVIAAREAANTLCVVCGWPLADASMNGCVRGNCSFRFVTVTVMAAPEYTIYSVCPVTNDGVQ